MYHLRFKGNHYEMGVKRGSIFNKCGVAFPLNIDQFQLSHGIESEKLLKEYFPEVCEEVKGITDTIHADYSKFISWMLAMSCCMYNLETNIPEVRGCTAFAVCYHDHVYYGRDNDLPPFLKEGSKSEIYRPVNGNTFNITTSSFINGEEGINKEGLAVAMTFVATDLKDIRPGFNAVFIVRYLLEKAGSAKEALSLLSDLPVSSNCNILLADKTGDMVVVECTSTIKKIREPVTIHKDLKVICTTNCFVSADMKQFEREDETYRSLERYNNVINAFKDYSGQDAIGYIEEILKGKHGFMCQYEKGLNFETIWSSVFDLDTLDIYRAEGDPRRKKYISDERLKR